MTSKLSIIAAGLAVGMAATAAMAEPAVEVPKSKQTVLGKYINAKDAYSSITGPDGGKVLFVDIRTAAELTYVGAPREIDAYVPFVEMANPPVWDDKAGRFALTPNAAFVAQIEAALARKGLAKTDKVILMCRSGERTARGVNALAAAGFTNAYNLYEGFEGDLSKDGRRDLDGWKNAGLPWSYKLDKAKMTIAPTPGK